MADIKKFTQYIKTPDAFDQTLTEQTCDAIFNESCRWNEYKCLQMLNFAVTQCLEGEEQYLEIGAFRGTSVTAALYGNNKKAQVIEPFDLWLPNGIETKKCFEKCTQTFNTRNRIELHQKLSDAYQDPKKELKIDMQKHSFDLNSKLPKIGVYYYDGNHNPGYTYRGLKNYEKYLADKAIVIADDTGMKEVAPDVEAYISESPYIIDVFNTNMGLNNQTVFIIDKNNTP